MNARGQGSAEPVLPRILQCSGTFTGPVLQSGFRPPALHRDRLVRSLWQHRRDAIDHGHRCAEDPLCATIGNNMAGTDSIRFEDLVASVSVRENERVTGIVAGSNPNHHQPTDKYDSYGEEDFRLGFNAAQTTLGGLAQLAGLTLVRPR